MSRKLEKLQYCGLYVLFLGHSQRSFVYFSLHPITSKKTADKCHIQEISRMVAIFGFVHILSSIKNCSSCLLLHRLIPSLSYHI